MLRRVLQAAKAPVAGKRKCPIQQITSTVLDSSEQGFPSTINASIDADNIALSTSEPVDFGDAGSQGSAATEESNTAWPARNGKTKVFAPWLDGDFFLALSIKEAHDLEAGNAMAISTAACDPFVRVTLQRPGAVALAEAETRVLMRNSNPMWEECLPFPLNDVSEDTTVSLKVFDRDIGHFNSFVGMVTLPLKEVLRAITDLGHETVYTLPLMGRSGTSRRSGRLVVGVTILEKRQYKEMCSVIRAIQDPDTVYEQLGGHNLHMRLHSFRGLGGLEPQQGLQVRVSLCSFVARLVLPSVPVVGGEADPEVDLVVPLAEAFRDSADRRGRERMQFGDVKVELYHGKVRIAKTQIPIWDVPFRPDPDDPQSLMQLPQQVASPALGAGSTTLYGTPPRYGTETTSAFAAGAGGAGVAAGSGGDVGLMSLVERVAARVSISGAAGATGGPPPVMSPTATSSGLGPSADREDPASRRSSTSGGLSTVVQVVPNDQVVGAPRDREKDREAERAPQGSGGLAALDELGILDAAAAITTSGPVLSPRAAGTARQKSEGGLTPTPSDGAEVGALQEQPATPPAVPTAPTANGPLWAGKRYTRRMQRIDKSLTQHPMMVLSMQLCRAELMTPMASGSNSAPTDSGSAAAAVAAATSSAGGAATGTAAASAGGGMGHSGFDMAATDVDEPGCGPLPLPEPYRTPVADFVVHCGPHELWRQLFTDSKPFNKAAVLEEMTGLKLGEWAPDTPGGGLAARRANYSKPSPVGPVPVIQDQTVLAKTDGGFVVLSRVTPTVPPIGHCVHVHMQIAGQHLGPSRTRLVATLKTEWFKKGMAVGLVKPTVESGSVKDSVKYYTTIRTELDALFGTEDATPAALAAARSAAAAAAAGTAAAAVAAAAAQPPLLLPDREASFALGMAGGPRPAAAAVAAAGGTVAVVTPWVVLLAAAGGGAVVVLLFLLVVQLLGVSRGVADTSREVARAGRALEEMAAAVGQLAGQLGALAQAVQQQHQQQQGCGLGGTMGQGLGQG